jgi:O-antigen/teichoic acid export membrane protein
VTALSPPKAATRTTRLWARLARSKTAAQAATFTISSAAVSGVAAVAAVLLARTMETSVFGSYSFAVSLLMFGAMFFEFGLFLPAARQATQVDEEEGRGIVGTALITFVPVALLFAVVIFGVSFWVDGWFNVRAGGALRVVSLLGCVYAFEFVALQLAQGLGRLVAYSVAAVLGRLLLVVAIVVVMMSDAELSVTAALVYTVVGLAAGWALLIAVLRPKFRGATRGVPELVRGAREYGFQIYLGRVLSIGTYNMDVLLVAVFTTASSVAYYRLAIAVSAMITLPAMGLSAVLFRRMVGEATIDGRVLAVVFGVSFGAAIAVALAAGPLVGLLFSPRYSPAAGLLVPLAFAAAVRGVTTIYNSYLSAHAKGRDLRSAALVLTASNIVLDVVLIPRYGAAGAAWGSLCALVANWIAHVYFYRRSISASAPVAVGSA